MQDKDFLFIEEVGSGTFASVYKGKMIKGDQDVALKKIYWNSSPSRISNELQALIKLSDSEGIIKFLCGYRTEDVVTVVTEYQRHQSLRDIIWEMDLPHIKSYMRQLLIATQSVHAKNIIHRDIKPGNFLYDIDSDKGVLCDFGLCEEIPENFQAVPFDVSIGVDRDRINFELEYPEKVTDRPQMDAPRAGTRGFRAPEVLWKYPHQTTAIDIWSVGVVFLSLLTRRYPFFLSPDDLTALCEIACIIDREKLNKAAELCGRYVKYPSVNKVAPFDQLIKQLNPESERMGIQTDAIDLLEHMLDPNMFTRYNAAECLSHPFFT